MMKRLAFAILFTSACVRPDGADGARAAIPAAENIQIKLPGAAALVAGEQGDVAHDVMAVLGETAEFYAFTRVVSRDLNGGAAFVLLLVKAVTDYPVTSKEGDTFIWGPWTETLNPAEWRLTVTETSAGTYEWSLEGRRKAEAGAEFEPIVFGTATPGEPGRGTGAFTMDFDTAERLDPVGNDGEGVLDVVYDLDSDPRSITMDWATLQATPQGGEEAVTLHYEYAEHSDGSGDFAFAIHGDLDDSGSLWEDASVRSQWLPTGEGRADVMISGGDLGAIVVEGTECWDAGFGRTYWTDSQGWAPTEGDAASCPVFTPAM
jgi:hypothetical protein